MTPTAYFVQFLHEQGELASQVGVGDEPVVDPVQAEFSGGPTSPEAALLNEFVTFCGAPQLSPRVDEFLRQRPMSQLLANA